MSSTSKVPAPRESIPPNGIERRSFPRIDVTWEVDCTDGETFLYSYITNISAMGIFIATMSPPVVGTVIQLKFEPPGESPFEVAGAVAWINPWHETGENLNPGFGVRFTDLDPEMRERLVSLVHAIAYLPGESDEA
jgi:type IV pilus assembly protein PilZ